MSERRHMARQARRERTKSRQWLRRQQGRHDRATLFVQLGCWPSHPDYRVELLRHELRRTPFYQRLVADAGILEQSFHEPLFPELVFPSRGAEEPCPEPSR